MTQIINIKIHSPSSTADTGSDCILIRQADTVAATLEVHNTSQPLRVRFPDGHIASSIGTSPIDEHRATSTCLQQSLFGISDVTNNDYDATFRKDGLYVPLPRRHTSPLQPKVLRCIVLDPPCPYPLTKNMYSLCSPLSVAQHLPHYCARLVKVTCQRSLDSRLRSSANINTTPSLWQWPLRPASAGP